LNQKSVRTSSSWFLPCTALTIFALTSSSTTTVPARGSAATRARIREVESPRVE
jgi:hypothetical protein